MQHNILVTKRNVEFIEQFVKVNYPTSDSKKTIELFYLMIISKTIVDWRYAYRNKEKYIGGLVSTSALAETLGFTEDDRKYLVGVFRNLQAVNHFQFEDKYYWSFNDWIMPTINDDLIRIDLTEYISNRLNQFIQCEYNESIDNRFDNRKIHTGDEDTIRIKGILNEFF